MRPTFDLRIQDLATKVRWIETLSAMLADATMLGQGRWDVRRMHYEVDLERIAYESHTVLEDREKIFEYPMIRSRLVISPVLSCVDGREAVAERWGGESMRALELRDRHELALVTSYGTTRLRLGDLPRLEIRDLGSTSELHTFHDYGLPAIDLGAASEIVRMRIL